jgi:hypothetical protein
MSDEKTMDTVSQVELLAAILAVRRAVKPVLKRSSNGHFDSKYANIQDVYEAIGEALNDNGVILEQWTSERDGVTFLHTQLAHAATGQRTRESVTRLRTPKDDMQVLGAAMTYGRRQQVMTVLQLAPQDDDGEGAVLRNGMSDKQREQIKGLAKATGLVGDAFTAVALEAVGKDDPDTYTKEDAEKLLKTLEDRAAKAKKRAGMIPAENGATR